MPEPRHRARYMSLQSATQHLASSTGAMLPAKLLGEDADGRLVGTGGVVACAMVVALALPLLLSRVSLALAPAGQSGPAHLPSVQAPGGPPSTTL